MAAATLQIKNPRKCDVLTFALAASPKSIQFPPTFIIKPMNLELKFESNRQRVGFTLVEMLVVIAIMSILMTAGAIGLGGMGGKGVTSGVASAESLFDEARAVAVGQRTRARVMVLIPSGSGSVTTSSPVPADHLRRIVLAYAEIDPATNLEKTPLTWILSSRATVLPDQVFFSKTYSKRNHDQKTDFGATDEMTLGTSYKANAGKYLFYEFNSEGICTTPGASFVLGSGARGVSQSALIGAPKVTSAGKRDFGGFVVWRNGRTSAFHSPTQISSDIQSLGTGQPF